MKTKKITTNVRLLIMVLAIATIPSFSNAAIISIRPVNNFLNNDTNILEVVLDTEGKTINVVEGNIQVINQEKNIKSLNTGGSSLSLWPNPPALSKDTISFVGGSPNGINGKEISLFRIVMETGDEKELQLQINKASVYLNDGLGTKIAVADKPITISTSANNTNNISQLDNILLSDKTPPEPFSIEIGKDNTLFDGKYFISFATTDKESGVRYYEISEGNDINVRSSSPYVLQDQSLEKIISVKAIDYAGNIRTETMTSPSKNILSTTSIILIICILIFMAIVGITIIKKKSRN